MSFSKTIISWYGENKRDLPWRKTTDPYIIWLSEVIMQQTRVEQGLPYFNRFLDAFPTVSDFAAANEEDILKLWQGLGYYSRGRNMHHTASTIVRDYAGIFPSSYKELVKLKGIGEYTAAAIASFSSNEAKAVVDGNVYRLLARYFGVDTPINSTQGKKEFAAIADELLDREMAGTNNQAIMEFGALQCKPKSPNCGICPLMGGCYALLNKKVNELPVKLKKLKVRQRYFNYLVCIDDGKILVNKRTGNDIWQNLYDLPLIESDRWMDVDDLNACNEMASWFGNKAHISKISAPVKHILTHQVINARFFEIDDFIPKFKNDDWQFIEIEAFDRLPQPKLIFGSMKLFLT